MSLYQDFVYWLTTQPTNYLLLLAIIGLLLFTVGLLLGYLLQRGKTKKALRKLTAAEREKAELQQKLSAGDEEQKTLARQLVKITTEKDEVLVQLREMRGNLEKINAESQRMQATNEQLGATNQSYATTIEDLNDQVIGLKTRNEQLLRGNGASLIVTDGEGQERADDRLAALERRLAILEDRLAAPATNEEEQINLGKPRHRVRIGAPSGEDAGHRDDLTHINTIGPFNQEQLNEAGIYRFEQIADWSDDDLDDYAAHIGYVAEIMREEDWIGQARRLAEADAPQPASHRTRSVDAKDLTVVSGIDAQVSQVLHEAGVRDLPTLAATPAAELQAMLEQAGRGLRAQHTLTWPEQAALADAGDWDTLEALQQELRSRPAT
ncbi:hypothetical protein [Lewinella sp. IMCC34191]|uniref:hypothetical protein n=1 Tax=Lewinella sp. IMCC34191 TaxID=2259172 RepID=UPI000E21DDDE|nr:hypothetical protein [Lewinella sp. IMCC34191]